MNNTPYFQTNLDVVNLYLSHVFNTFEDEAIIFVCTDQDDRYYFCICYDLRDSLNWVVNQVPINVILNVIDNTMSLYDAITYGEQDKILCSYDYENGEQYHYTPKQELNDNILPVKGVMLQPDSDLSSYENILESKQTAAMRLSSMITPCIRVFASILDYPDDDIFLSSECDISKCNPTYLSDFINDTNDNDICEGIYEFRYAA